MKIWQSNIYPTLTSFSVPPFLQSSLHGKLYFFSPDVLKRWSVPKICDGLWSFLCYWDIWYFFFPKIWSYPLRRKWNLIFLKEKKKIHGNMIFPSNVPKRWYFQKGLRWGMIFLVLSGKMVFFPKNMVFFPWEKSEGRSFSRNTWKYEIFCGHVRVLQTWRCAPLSKKIKTMLPHKNTPEGDRRSRLTF